MEWVVVAAQAVQDSLLGSNFVFGDVVWFAILRDRFALGRAGNCFGEFFACGLRTKIEGRTLSTRQHQTTIDSAEESRTNKRAYATPFSSTRVLSRSTMIPLSSLEVS